MAIAKLGEKLLMPSGGDPSITPEVKIEDLPPEGLKLTANNQEATVAAELQIQEKAKEDLALSLVNGCMMAELQAQNAQNAANQPNPTTANANANTNALNNQNADLEPIIPLQTTTHELQEAFKIIESNNVALKGEIDKIRNQYSTLFRPGPDLIRHNSIPILKDMSFELYWNIRRCQMQDLLQITLDIEQDPQDKQGILAYTTRIDVIYNLLHKKKNHA